jgi:uncharacterized protein
MKKLSLFLCFWIIIFASCKTNTNNSSTFNEAVVQDYAQIFSDSEKEALTQKIINYELVSTNEICIYTIDSLPKNTKALYHAIKIGEELGVGKKEKDNGLLILISKYDRQIAIATGNGTEKIITDYVNKIIIDSTIVPEFKKGQYFYGIDKALDSIIRKWH